MINAFNFLDTILLNVETSEIVKIGKACNLFDTISFKVEYF